MRILITGATGFVGSHLTTALTRGLGKALSDPNLPGVPPSVRVLARASSDTSVLGGSQVELVTGDLDDPSSLVRAVADVDVVLHLAALTRARTEKEFRTANEVGTRSLLEAARAGGTTTGFIYVSSLAAVGPSRAGRPVTNEDEPRPLTAYGRSKLAGERACEECLDDFRVAILRPPAVYGPRDRDLLPFFQFANRGLLPVPMGAVRFLQMIHVSDLARAIWAAAVGEKARGVYHIADPQAYSWTGILDLMAAAVGKKGRRIPVPQGLVRVAGAMSGTLGRLARRAPVFDGDKARELLAPGWLCETEAALVDFGFRAGKPLEAGLRETAAWYRGRGWLR